MTSDAHGSARILDIDGTELIKRFKERKEVAVISGFQGISKETGRITTLGRGGSDTSAVAIAAADQGRPLRHLYRRRRRLHHRPARRAEGAAPRQGRVRGNAGTGLARRQGAAGALGRARHGAQCAHLRALELRQAGGYRSACEPAARHADLQRGGDRGTTSRHRHRLFQGRSPDLDPPRARTSPASPPRSSARSPRPASMST